MCGRFTQSSKISDYARLLDAVPLITAKPSYNIVPSQLITICRQTDVRNLVQVRWGLIPHWAKESKTGYSMINARAETVATKPSFREAYKKRRCLIPTEGFYEWRQSIPKQPFFIHRQDNKPFALAGLWERWEKDGEVIESGVIIVTEANKLVGTIHDRMPVIIDAVNYERWLDPSQGGDAVSDLLVPHEERDYEIYPVSTAMNKPANNEPSLTEKISL